MQTTTNNNGNTQNGVESNLQEGLQMQQHSNSAATTTRISREKRSWTFAVPSAQIQSMHRLWLLTIGGISVQAPWCGQLGEHYVAWSYPDEAKTKHPSQDHKQHPKLLKIQNGELVQSTSDNSTSDNQPAPTIQADAWEDGLPPQPESQFDELFQEFDRHENPKNLNELFPNFKIYRKPRSSK